MSYNARAEKSYNGDLMKKGKTGEQIVIEWLKNRKEVSEVIDMREFRISQRLDVDCGIETVDGEILLAEIKSDSYLGKTQNVLFEVFRINHFISSGKIFYLGWAFRSPAKYLLYYAPFEAAVYRFEFENVRKLIGKYTSEHEPRIKIVPTDRQKTTFSFVLPISFFKNNYIKYFL